MRRQGRDLVAGLIGDGCGAGHLGIDPLVDGLGLGLGLAFFLEMHCRKRIGIGDAGIDVFRRCRIGFLGILLGDLGLGLGLDIVATGKGGGNGAKGQRAGVRDRRKGDRSVLIGLGLLIDRNGFRLGFAFIDLPSSASTNRASAETMKVPLFTKLAVAELSPSTS